MQQREPEPVRFAKSSHEIKGLMIFKKEHEWKNIGFLFFPKQVARKAMLLDQVLRTSV